MKRTRDELSYQLLDLEARVGDSDEEEEDEVNGDDEDFIEDEPTIDAQFSPPRRHFTDVDANLNREEGWRDLVASLEERYAVDSETTRRVVEDDRNTRPLDPAIIASVENITRLPENDDYPLWRVRCKPGSEEAVVFSLPQTVAPRHELRSAFTHPRLGGWVYLETTMNEHMRKLLKITSGVIHNRGGLVYRGIDRSDGLQVLNMAMEMGKWVMVRKGTYRGDVGHVKSIQGSRVQLLLVPRLLPPKSSCCDGKHTQSPPAPALFDHVTVKQIYDTEPVDIDENTYLFQGDTFEHGLIVRHYAFDSVSTAVSSMPLRIFTAFRGSTHPNLFAHSINPDVLAHPTLIACHSIFPRPTEWCFAEGDEAFIAWPHAYRSGTIYALRTDSVELASKEFGVVRSCWLNIRKIMREGDHIEITGGEYQGQTGWVVNVQEGVASIIRSEGDDHTVIETHVNLLKHIVVPHALGTYSNPTKAILRSERTPWINTDIIITDRHSLRTYPGIVKNVLRGQQTRSGLKVEIQVTSLDFNAPFRLVTLDYDSVVEASRGIKLYDYSRPTSELFTPRNWAPNPPPVLIQQPSLPSPNSVPGFATPIPEPSLSSSPAWDPSSEIPQSNTDHPVESSKHLPESQVGLRHSLLDSRLLNVKLRVIVTGGGFNEKELTASVWCLEGQLSLRHTVYKSSTYLEEAWVAPKHPHPTRDTNLLVVIKGEHFGKHVRRVHHYYEGEDTSAIVILAVVERIAGHVDRVTAERLKLDVSYLCVCDEPKEDKARNNSLMKGLREEARQIQQTRNVS